MSEKFFVVSEAELDQVFNAGRDWELELHATGKAPNMPNILAACRARPVPPEAKGFYIIDENGDTKCLEIKR